MNHLKSFYFLYPRYRLWTGGVRKSPIITEEVTITNIITNLKPIVTRFSSQFREKYGFSLYKKKSQSPDTVSYLWPCPLDPGWRPFGQPSRHCTRINLVDNAFKRLEARKHFIGLLKTETNVYSTSHRFLSLPLSLALLTLLSSWPLSLLFFFLSLLFSFFFHSVSEYFLFYLSLSLFSFKLYLSFFSVISLSSCFLFYFSLTLYSFVINFLSLCISLSPSPLVYIFLSLYFMSHSNCIISLCLSVQQFPLLSSCVFLFLSESFYQCDQIASLCFQFGPFSTMKLCPTP